MLESKSEQKEKKKSKKNSKKGSLLNDFLGPAYTWSIPVCEGRSVAKNGSQR